MNYLFYMLDIGLGNPFINTKDPSKSVTSIPEGEVALGTYVNLLYWVLVATAAASAILMIVYGGIKYSTSGGDATKISEARDTIVGAIVGLVLLLLTSLIVSTIGI